MVREIIFLKNMVIRNVVSILDPPSRNYPKRLGQEPEQNNENYLAEENLAFFFCSRFVCNYIQHPYLPTVAFYFSWKDRNARGNFS